MPVKPIPDGYHSVTPYLMVKGAEKLIDFMKEAFGATERTRGQRPDGSVSHAEMTIGDSVVMLGDPIEEFPPMPAAIHLYVEDCDSTYKKALQAGGESVQEPADQFYGDRMAGVRDPFGNQWWIATHFEDLTQDEIAKRAASAHQQS
jgi:PhnB protein